MFRQQFIGNIIYLSYMAISRRNNGDIIIWYCDNINDIVCSKKSTSVSVL